MLSERIVIVTAGNFGLEVADWLIRCKANVAGFIDDVKSGSDILPSPLLGNILDYKPSPEHRLLIAISDSNARKKIALTLYERGAQFTTMGCDTVTAASASWGEGTICCPMALLGARSKIGAHCHINTKAGVGHHVTMGDYCTISSLVDICGWAEIGERVFMGSHAVILPHVKVGDGAIIGAGSIVTRDVPAGATVYAEAARML